MRWRRIYFGSLFLGAMLFCLTASRSDRPLERPAATLLARYGSIPKGVLLEGAAEGVPAARGVRWEGGQLRFPTGERYAPPLNRAETADLFRAVAEDDRVGVSIVIGEREIAYGRLPANHALNRRLFAADLYLISIVFGWRENLGSTALPNGYRPLASREGRRPTVCFSTFDQYRFGKTPGGVLVRVGCNLTLTLVPMGRGRAPDGGYLPDEAVLETARFAATDLENLAEIHRRRSAYLALPTVASAAAVGEVAALARSLRAQGVDLWALAEAIAPPPVRRFAQRLVVASDDPEGDAILEIAHEIALSAPRRTPIEEPAILSVLKGSGETVRGVWRDGPLRLIRRVGASLGE